MYLRDPIALGATPPAAAPGAELKASIDAAAEYTARAAGWDPQTNPKAYALNKLAFNWAYGEARSGLAAVINNPIVAKIRAAGDAAVGIGQTVQRVTARFGHEVPELRGYTADATGVVDFVGDAGALVKGISQFAQSFGALPPVLQQITGWAQVAGGCATGIATGGPAGIVACGMSLVARLFSMFSSTKYVNWASNKARAIFVPPPAAQTIIATDALRLAQVLRRYYGVPSFVSMRDRLEGASNVDTQPFYWIANGYPDRPPVGPDGALDMAQLGNTPIPAHTLRTALQMMDTQRSAHDAGGNIMDALAFIGNWRNGLEPPGEPQGRNIYRRYDWDCDVNVQAIETGAFLARSAIAATGSPVIWARITGGWATGGWPDGRTKSYPPRPEEVAWWGSNMTLAPIFVGRMKRIDFSPFLRVDELLNFFAAITVVEMRHDSTRATIRGYNFGQYNPVRLAMVRDSSRSGQPPESGGTSGDEFSKRCWTNLARAGFSAGQCNALFDTLLTGSMPIEVVKEAAAMRLMSALSFLHMQYVWSASAVSERQDLIKQLPGVDGDPYGELKMPVDPRQAVPAAVGTKWTLRPAETASPNLVRLPAPTGHGLYAGTDYFGTRSFAVHKEVAAAVQELRPAPGLPTFVGDDRHRPARTDGNFLASQIDAREAIVRSAILAARAKAASDPVFLTSTGPMVMIDFAKELPKMRASQQSQAATTTLLLAAAAVAALTLL